MRIGSADKTKVETGLQEVDLLTRQKWRLETELRGGSADTTKVERGLREVDLLT